MEEQEEDILKESKEEPEEDHNGFHTRLTIDKVMLKNGSFLTRKRGTPNGFMKDNFGRINGVTFTEFTSGIRMIVPWHSIEYIMESVTEE